MSDKKHIDRLFQEKFRDFDVMPNDKLWEGIEARLDKKKKKQRIIPILWKLGGVAAVLLLMFAIGTTFNNTEDTTVVADSDSNNTEIENNKKSDKDTALQKENTIIASDNLEKGNSIKNEDNQGKDAYSKSPLLNSNSSKNNTVVAVQNSTSTKKQKETFSSVSSIEPNGKAITSTSNKYVQKNETEAENKIQLKSQEEIKAILNSDSNETNAVVKTDKTVSNTSNTEGTIFTEISEKIAEKDKGQDIEEAIAEAKTNNEEEREIRRWSIAPNVAPVYFNSLGKGSSIDAQFDSNTTTSDISMSYGVKGSYVVNNRLKINGRFLF